MSGQRFSSHNAPCPPQPWPAGLPPCPTKRIGLTDPLTPHAAHPARFQQVQQQRTAQAVYNTNDAGGEASLASLAAQEQARRRMFVSSSQSCGAGLKNVLVTLDSSRADVLSCTEEACADGKSECGTTFNVRLETPMTEMLGNRFVYGQVRSWELALQQTCTEDKERALAIVHAPVNGEPLTSEEVYSLPISEQYAITPQRQALYLPLSGSRFPEVLLPLTLARIERIVAFRWHRGHSGARRLANIDDDDLDCGSDDSRLPLYAFRTAEAHGFAPGLRFSLVLPSKLDDDPYEPDNADQFVVVDTGYSVDPVNAGHWLDCREFVALRCKRTACAAREARVFDPWDAQGSECRKYGCEETAPRIDAPMPNAALFRLRHNTEHGSMRKKAGRIGKEDRLGKQEERHNKDKDLWDDKDVFWVLQDDNCVFAYVPPATNPKQLAYLANGALRAQAYCGCDVFDDLGIQVRYEPTVDQFIASDARGTLVQMRSLFGDDCGAASTLNFPLTRSGMVVSECALDYKQAYLERAVTGFHYFNVQENVNDLFLVRLDADSNNYVPVEIPEACYPARFFVQAVQKALNDAFGTQAVFRVDYRVFERNSLLAARAEIQRTGSANGLQALRAPRIDPYTSLVFAVTIEADCAFSLSFACSRGAAFANLIDYDAQQVYELKNFYTSRSLSLEFSDERLQREWIASVRRNCALDCVPCPRRTYTARVNEAQGSVTLQQRIQRPYRVCKVDKCGNAVRVQIVHDSNTHSNEKVLFCQNDVLIAARTNPLAKNACCAEEVLVSVAREHSVFEFDLCDDPFPEDGEFWLWAMPVGFNLHLNGSAPRNESAFNYFDSQKSAIPQRVASANVVTRFLGFQRPTTRSGAFRYTSDQTPASVIDESILVQVPQLLALATSESRETLYTPQSPFDSAMTQYYAQLLLDRATGIYRAYPALVSPLPNWSAPRDLLPASGASGVPCLQSMTVELLRPDGNPYRARNNPFVLTFELIYVRK